MTILWSFAELWFSTNVLQRFRLAYSYVVRNWKCPSINIYPYWYSLLICVLIYNQSLHWPCICPFSWLAVVYIFFTGAQRPLTVPCAAELSHPVQQAYKQGKIPWSTFNSVRKWIIKSMGAAIISILKILQSFQWKVDHKFPRHGREYGQDWYFEIRLKSDIHLNFQSDL